MRARRSEFMRSLKQYPRFPRHAAGPWHSTVLLLLLTGLTGCAALPEVPVAPSPDRPWQADASVWNAPSEKASSAVARPAPGTGDAVFSIPAVPQLPTLAVEVPEAQGRALDLPHLIDMAQRSNHQTREAWNRAREAALSAGLTDALFLPLITANIIAGEQRVTVPVDLPLQLGTVDVKNKLSGTTPFLSLTWLLFDFGERKALREGAQYAALAANVLFNATHQKLIRDVTDAYYRYNAARKNADLARQSLQQHEQVLQAVEARFAAGLATKIDIALARQALAQGRLNVVTHQGLERTGYLALLQAMGLPAYTQLSIAAPTIDRLPSATEPLTQQRIEQVVAQRADIAAAYAALKVTEAGQRTAQAAFLPKAYMGAILARNHSNFQAGNLSALGAQNTATGVLVGVSVPLYDGGLRSRQLSKANVAREQAQLRLEQLQMTAVREIVAAEQVLQTALQGHDAAQELVQTATVAHTAALESYKVGRASTVLLTESSIQLHKAQQALAEAQYASVAAAANLAFAMGTMVSAQQDWWPSPAKNGGATIFSKE